MKAFSVAPPNAGYIKDAAGRVEDWVRDRMVRHRAPSGPHVQERGDGRWILVSERKTDDRGTVAVYSDITELKQRENQLADKSRALEQLSNQLARYLSPQSMSRSSQPSKALHPTGNQADPSSA